MIMVKEIIEETIERAVYESFLRANYYISEDIENAIHEFREAEPGDTARNILGQIEENYRICKKENVALCQDCGMAMVFIDLGQDIHINGNLERAVQNGVREAYQSGYLRKSVVKDPLFDRTNTGDNTPAIIHTRIVEGDNLSITAVAKGFGSENCSRVKIFVPANTLEEIKDFIVSVVTEAGPNTCPPTIVGVGIGGTMDMAALMAKRATIRDISVKNPDPNYQKLEQEILDKINATGIGPAGFGGRTTSIAVNIEHFPTHIASIPVAVNLCCHASRHATTVL